LIAAFLVKMMFSVDADLAADPLKNPSPALCERRFPGPFLLRLLIPFHVYVRGLCPPFTCYFAVGQESPPYFLFEGSKETYFDS